MKVDRFGARIDAEADEESRPAYSRFVCLFHELDRDVLALSLAKNGQANRLPHLVRKLEIEDLRRFIAIITVLDNLDYNSSLPGHQPEGGKGV